MARRVAIGVQDYASLIEKNCFYIDKTGFIKDWWESEDAVTLITRPRRFGKTITMNMCDYFFSNKYAGRSDLFEGLDVPILRQSSDISLHFLKLFFACIT